MDAFGNGANARGAVIHGVHRRHVGQQGLRRADVGRRLLAPDVLLARLQRHAIRGLALRVDGHADDATGQVSHVILFRGKKRGVRSAEPDGHSEALRVAEDDVGAHFAGRRDQRERQQIRRHGDERAGRLRS